MSNPTVDAAVQALSKTAADKGLLIEAGWLSLTAYLPKDASKEQLIDMRMAFFAGAQHVWGSVMTIMDADREPTEADLRRIGLISDELDLFVETLKANLPPRA